MAGLFSFWWRKKGKETASPSARPIGPPRTERAACPYCGVIIEPRPERSRKCPECGNKIIVRTRYSDRIKLLLTEEQTAQFDRERKVQAKRNDCMRRSGLIGYTRQAFEAKERELGHQWNSHPQPGDVFWAMANQRVIDCLEKGDWHNAAMAYFQQALYLHDEGKPFFHLLQEATRADLRRYATTPIAGPKSKVRILTSKGQSCPSCQKNEGKVFTIEQALRTMPIPNPSCTNLGTGWCRCLWVLEIEVSD